MSVLSLFTFQSLELALASTPKTLHTTNQPYKSHFRLCFECQWLRLVIHITKWPGASAPLEHDDATSPLLLDSKRPIQIVSNAATRCFGDGQDYYREEKASSWIRSSKPADVVCISKDSNARLFETVDRVCKAQQKYAAASHGQLRFDWTVTQADPNGASRYFGREDCRRTSTSTAYYCFNLQSPQTSIESQNEATQVHSEQLMVGQKTCKARRRITIKQTDRQHNDPKVNCLPPIYIQSPAHTSLPFTSDVDSP